MLAALYDDVVGASMIQWTTKAKMDYFNNSSSSSSSQPLMTCVECQPPHPNSKLNNPTCPYPRYTTMLAQKVVVLVMVLDVAPRKSTKLHVPTWYCPMNSQEKYDRQLEINEAQ